ncbi:MAG TPA: DUF6519 domain-containing protein [Haliangiales bacterium]|nr:DUF6519 domain-containing protein [Haliangiales bacterium]
MNGDFSQWRPFDPTENFTAVLHQQGRVLLDQDWNDQARIVDHWERRAGKDVIGDAIAAVPAGSPNGFKIEAAQVVNVGGSDRVELDVRPGHAWADGLLVYLGGDPSTTVSRVATYLEPPIQDPVPAMSSITGDVRDAVVLEVSREAFNGFQWPERLIEPALGGPDTTERVQTRIAFRLLRLGPDEDCHNIHGKLKDNPANFGKLTVSLQPTVVVPGDCPVVEGGGYTGFEHQLYRIEIAAVNAGGPKFKWSQFNGGLVGRGRFNAGAPPKVEINANLTAIVTSGLTSFYLEALEFDTDLGHWRVTYGATATLNNQQELELAAAPVFGTLPASADPVFFRLWNGLLDVSAFTNAVTPVELRDGIRLVFDAPAGKTYRPGDYWVFPVRAGEIKNPQVLINAETPQGIRYHRVPLAELNWNAARNITAPTEIEDCRRRFRPLTKQDTCCTWRVGDGLVSFGDFDSIQAAIDALPPEGGHVCVLPGVFVENIVITSRENITLTGCGPRSRIVSTAPAGEFAEAGPVIQVRGGRNIAIDSLAVEAHETGPGLVLEGADPNFGTDQVAAPLIGVTLAQLHVSAAAKSAIRVDQARDVTIRECRVQMKDTTCLDHAIFALADDLLIERNVVEVPARQIETPTLSVAAPPAAAAGFLPGSLSRGGIQIGGTSDRVRIINNLIRGGAGNGITLGSLIFIDDNQEPLPPIRWPKPRPVDPCDPQKPATGIIVVVAVPLDDGNARPASAGTLTEVVIERNRIYQMGMNGIGVVGFFDLSGADEFITMEGLSILGNDIRHCLRRSLEEIPAAMINSAGYGGISLADVERLVIHDNQIADNGPSHLEPVCGVFSLHAEGMAIARNRVLNNGAKTEAPAAQAKIGRRGGINVVYAVSPVTPVRFGTQTIPGQNGEPALKVHENVVSVPLGQALTVTALGPLAVTDNQFTSRGVVQRGAGATFIAATVAILDLGLSNELYLQFLAFSAVAKGSLSTAALAAPAARPGLDDQRLGAYLANGNVLFADNQCVLDVFETGVTLSASSITIFSLDDISFHGNQCDCNLADDLVLAHVVLFGFSLRASDNRLKESLLRALFSAMTLGFLNMTTNNQTTHCLLARAFVPAYLVNAANTVLIDPAGTGYCERFSVVQNTFGKATGG